MIAYYSMYVSIWKKIENNKYSDEQKKSDTRAHITWFHLYEVQEHVKVLCGDISQKSG